jgi:hypothetical protein
MASWLATLKTPDGMAGSAGAARTKWTPARIVRVNAIFRFVGEKGNEAKKLMRGISWPQR